MVNEVVFERMKSIYKNSRSRLWEFNLNRNREADPFTIKWVDPTRINWITVGTSDVDIICDGDSRADYSLVDYPVGGFHRSQAGKLIGGDWDQRKIHINDYLPYRSFQKHFDENVRWENTIFYNNVVDVIEDGHTLWGCESEKEFLYKRCDYIDNLYQNILKDGYKPASKLHNGKKLYHEVEINIGRDGRMLFNDGKHRFILARIIGIDHIPVRIIVRHKQLNRFSQG